MCRSHLLLRKNSFKFIERNYAIFLRVVLCNQFINLRQRHILPKLLEGVVHLGPRNLSSTLNVKHREDAPQLLVVEEGRSVDSCGQELRVINHTIASVIEFVNHRLDLIFCQVQ